MLMILATLSSALSGTCDADNDFCGAHHVSEPLRSCTQGFSYDEVEKCCLAERVYEPLTACAHGGKDLGDGTCLCSSHPRIKCQDGYTYDKKDKVCVLTELATMIPSCAHRPELEGTLSDDGRFCHYYKDMPVVKRCPYPFKLSSEGDTCVSYEPVVPSVVNYSCPDGWSLDGEQCILVERVDCENEKVVKHSKCKKSSFRDCAPEPFEGCDDCVVEEEDRRLCAHCKVKAPPELICQAAECNEVIASCDCVGLECSGPCRAKPHLFVEDQSLMKKKKSFTTPVLCERYTSMPAKPYCPAGMNFNHHKKDCCLPVVQAPVQKCRYEELEGRGCGKKLKYLADHLCPSPFEVRCGDRVPREGKLAHPGHCECVRVSVDDPVAYCPEGFRMDVGGECVQTILAEAYCPEKDALLMDDMCHRVEREPVRLEYSVTYITEENCELEDCIKRNVPIHKRKIVHKEIKFHNGKAKTKCHESKCVDYEGRVVVEPAIE